MRPEPDVQVEGWFFPAHEADGASSAAVLFFHGNGDRIDWHKETARIYTERGISVLLAGYRGYGRSSGSPSVDKVRSDAAAWYDLLAKQPEVDAGRILVHGYSLGSAFAAQAADQRPVLGVILESPFSSLKSMARHRWIYLYLARERLDTASIVSRHDWPVLILHGTRDTVVPYSEGVRVAEAAQDRGQFESFDAQHDVGSADWNRYEQLVSGFTAEQVAVAAERKR
jgi:alpha-beta hydrolase superfamily lysophospholipase